MPGKHGRVLRHWSASPPNVTQNVTQNKAQLNLLKISTISTADLIEKTFHGDRGTHEWANRQFSIHSSICSTEGGRREHFQRSEPQQSSWSAQDIRSPPEDLLQGTLRISGRLLKTCCRGLSGVFFGLFNRSLAQHSVPALWKSSIICPVPKHSNPTCNNDFRPVALTSIVVKSLAHSH